MRKEEAVLSPGVVNDKDEGDDGMGASTSRRADDGAETYPPFVDRADCSGADEYDGAETSPSPAP